MKSILLFSTTVLLALGVNAKNKFGGEITLKDSMPLSKAIDTSKFGKEILVSGMVKKVCEKKGCWMSLQSEGASTAQKVRVKFKDYGFFVPTSLLGKKVFVQGILEQKEVSVKDARHYAKDAGKSEKEIMAITKPQQEMRFIASAVRVHN